MNGFATIPTYSSTENALYYLVMKGADWKACIYVNWPDGLPHPPEDQKIKLIEQFERDGKVRSTVEEIAEVLGSDLFYEVLIS